MSAMAATARIPQTAPQWCESEIAGHRVLCDFSGLLYWPEESLLVVSDLHLEKGASFASRGAMLPPYDTAATLAALAARMAYWRPARVISLGDSFHDGKVSACMPQAYRNALAGLMAGRDWIWVAGNHDPAPPHGLGGCHVEEIAIGALIFRHEPQAGRSPGEVAGHLHPQARIVRRGKAVRRPCFASDGERMIMPSFGFYTGGLNIRDRAFHGLFDNSRLHAHLLGRDRLYTIAGRSLV